MWALEHKIVVLWSLLFTFVVVVRPEAHGNNPPPVTSLTDLFAYRSFKEGFLQSFGGPNVQITKDGSGVDLILNKNSGSGFVSQNKFQYGFFSAAMKLPADYSAGIVVAFYMSNADGYPHNHDEIDFELLGHEKRKQWVLQTNIYGNGSVGTGREEKIKLWFDPTEGFHHYSIIWNNHHIVFLVDNVPVREAVHNDAISRVYPSKPMSVYSTIWDGSQWATHGGKKPVDYKFAPFLASFKEMQIEGCTWNKTSTTNLCSKNGANDPIEGQNFIKLSQQQQMGMEWVRKNFMIYSYCDDPGRYKVTLPECPKSSKEKLGFLSR